MTLYLILGSIPPNISPYRYPYEQKAEIGKLVKEIWNSRTFHPSNSCYSHQVVVVKRMMSHGGCVFIRGNLISSILKISFLFLLLMNY